MSAYTGLRKLRWTAVATVAAVALFVSALSGDVYNLTSPEWFTWHVALRKAYSVVAFFVVGYLVRRALAEGGRAHVVWPCILGLAAYSWAIEIGQYLLGSTEGLAFNVFDVACGALGGTLAVADRLVARTRTKSARPS